MRGQAILTSVSILIALLSNWLLPQLTSKFLWAEPPLTDFLLSPQLNWVWSLHPAAQLSDWTGSFESGWRISGHSLSCHTYHIQLPWIILQLWPYLHSWSSCALAHETLVLIYIRSSLPLPSTAEMSLFSDVQLWTSCIPTLYVLSIISVDWMLVYSDPADHIWTPNPQGESIRKWVFGGCLGHEGRASSVGLVPLFGEPRELPGLFHHVRTQQEGAVYKQKGSPCTPYLQAPLSWALSLWNWGINVCCF